MSDRTVLPHLTRVEAVRLAGSTPLERGRARGTQLATSVRRTAAGYADLFTTLGISEADQRAAAAASLDALRAWSPHQLQELTGIAEGAGLELVDLGRTVARTEILTLAPPAVDECSTVAHQAAGSSVSVQTWDWYARFADRWHLQRVEPLAGEQVHAGFSEYGMPGKVGLNGAGLGVHLNILRHEDDAAGGVPVHSVLARLLAEATDLDEGVAMIRDAPTTSSSVITLVTADRVAMVEVAPDGVSAVETEAGWLLHTNHFLAEDRQRGALLTHQLSTTHERLDYIRATTAEAATPEQPGDLIPLLCSPLEDHSVALLPDERKPEHERNATLVTVLLDPAARTVRLSPGAPQFAAEASVSYRL